MRKLIILLLVLSSCKKELYYPSKQFFDEYNPKEIDISNLNYGEIVDSLTNQIFNKKRHFFKIEDSNRIYKISPFTYSGGLIKERNALEINNGSIHILNKKYSKSELQKYLKLHYENNGKIEYLSTSPKYAFVKLVLDKKEKSKILKEELFNLFKNFEETSIKNKKNIDFSVMLTLPLEMKNDIPPPPKSIEIIKE